jgi:phosphoribosyl 1,2-cyclic phosphate phosphodiesterase
VLLTEFVIFLTMLKVKFLGTGTSTGIPVIGCRCGVCRSRNPKNRRLRSSVRLSFAGKSVIIDTTPDFRTQVLQYRIARVDAILLTHSHADHLHGLDDVRPYNFIQGKPIDLFLHRREIRIVREKFDYIFNPKQIGGGIPQIKLVPIGSTFDMFGQPVQRLDIKHGIMDTVGFRLGNFAYAVDANCIPKATQDKMLNLDVLVLSGLKFGPHPTHFTIPESLEIIQRIKPKKTYFTHICHEVEHADFSKYLKKFPGVYAAYDGLEISSTG